MSRLTATGKIILTYVLDPPGWIPAWILTASVIYAAKKAAVGNPQALEVFRILAHTYEVTLGLWLAYKGLKALPEIVSAWKKPRSPRPQDTEAQP